MIDKLLFIGVILSYIMIFVLLMILPLRDGPYYTPHEISRNIHK